MNVAATVQWYALWTRSNSERLVHDQLAAKGFQVFLPTLDTWSRHASRKRVVSLPMFPGYLFLRHVLDKASYVEILKARGLVRVLGNWDRLMPLPDAEIQAIERAASSRLPMMGHPFLCVGQRVRVVRGPMAQVEGFLVRTQPDKGLLVLSVDLLRQSVAVVVDCTDVTPA